MIETKVNVVNDTPETTEVPNDLPDEELAPPKPPLPGLKVPEHWYEKLSMSVFQNLVSCLLQCIMGLYSMQKNTC